MKTSRRSISFKPDSKMQFGELNINLAVLFVFNQLLLRRSQELYPKSCHFGSIIFAVANGCGTDQINDKGERIRNFFPL